jgi:carbon-monoxide dehydrogenase medium subunit
MSNAMVDFDYARPKTLAEATRLLTDEPEAKALAGGQSLIPALKQRLARPTLLVDLQALDEMRGIEVTDTHVRLGAFTRHADVAASARIADALPALVHMANGIAHPQVRHMGTIGGSIAHNDPGADYPAALLGLRATICTDRRRIAADEFFIGLFDTPLEPSELVLQIEFPRYRHSGYCKIAHPASGLVNTGVWVTRLADGVRVAVNGASPCVFRHAELERRLAARFDPASLDDFRQPVEGLNSDLHASAEYRAQLLTVAARRALAMALQQ